jgi:hypothetical protein
MDLLKLGAISRAFHADGHNFKVRLDPTLNDFAIHGEKYKSPRSNCQLEIGLTMKYRNGLLVSVN